MCDPVTIAALMASGTAVGTAAGAASFGTALSTIGTVIGIGGSLAQGAATRRAEEENARLLEEQAKAEAILTGIEDQRTRERFRDEMAAQSSQLAQRGVALDSPTAVLLAEEAGQEMSFASQEVRSRGAARQTEIKAGVRAARARGQLASLTGGLSAAGKFLSAAPDIWPGLKNDAVLS